MQRTSMKLLPLALIMLGGCTDAPTAVVRALDTAPRTLTHGPVTPNDGGVISSAVVTIANGPAGEFSPRVSGDGDLVCYYDASLSALRYWKFSTGVSNTVPLGGGNCAVDGSRIVSSRFIPDGEDSDGSRQAIMLFNASTSIGMELDPQIGSWRVWPAIGNNTVAFAENVGNEQGIRVVDLASPNHSQVLVSDEDFSHSRLNLSPDGNIIVWQRCDGGSNCGVLQAVRTGSIWSIWEFVGEDDHELWPDTDGAYIAYLGEFGATEGTETDILIQAVNGGPVTRLVIPHWQGPPRITRGVISFYSVEILSPGSVEVFVHVYVMATNTLYKIGATSGADNNDLAILPNGEVRMVWDVPGQSQIATSDVFATTFRLPGSFSFGGFLAPIDNLPTVNVAKAGAAIPVRFSLGGDRGLNIFAVESPSSVTVACNSSAPTGTVEETATAGNSSLSYDATSDSYSYIWKTNKGWANSCRRLTLRFIDGTVANADFQFTK